MKTNLYELSDEEIALIEGLRQGQMVLDGEEWLKLSGEEQEVIEVMRTGRYGEVTIRFVEGEPKIARVALDILHGKFVERQAALELIPKLQEKYGSPPY